MIGEADRAKQLVTLVIPAFNEEENLTALYERVTKVIEEVKSCEFRMLLIDNCSTDRTGELARELCERDSRWRYIRFSRNFGFETSLAAGLHYARGDALIYLPSDLQDPPELIPEMIERWREGYDIVYGELNERRDGSRLKSFGAYLAYRLIYHLSDIKIPLNATDYRLISRRAIDALQRCGERSRYLRGLSHWVGFRQIGVAYDRASRSRGVSTANLLFCIGFAVNAVVAFSSRPLRVASLLGLFVTGGSLLGGVVYTALLVLSRSGWIGFTPPAPGWTTEMLVIFFFGGVQCLFLGTLGEYLAQVHIEVKQRPLWLLADTAGFPAAEDPLGNGAD